MRNVFKELEANKFIGEMFEGVSNGIPPMPQEVLEWDIDRQELFCILADMNLQSGSSWEVADKAAIEAVKKSPWFKQ